MLERVIFPVITYATIAVALSVCVYLFFTLKRGMDSAHRNAAGEHRRLTEELQTLRARMSEIEGEMAAFCAGKSSLQPPRSINLTKRTQALRMVRRGETPERIAAALTMSPREVQLLMKVQKLAADPVSKVSA